MLTGYSWLYVVDHSECFCWALDVFERAAGEGGKGSGGSEQAFKIWIHSVPNYGRTSNISGTWIKSSWSVSHCPCVLAVLTNSLSFKLLACSTSHLAASFLPSHSVWKREGGARCGWAEVGSSRRRRLGGQAVRAAAASAAGLVQEGTGRRSQGAGYF